MDDVFIFNKKPYIRRLLDSVVEESDANLINEYEKNNCFFREYSCISFDLFKNEFNDFEEFISSYGSVHFKFLKHYDFDDSDMLNIQFTANIGEE